MYYELLEVSAWMKDTFEQLNKLEERVFSLSVDIEMDKEKYDKLLKEAKICPMCKQEIK